MRQTFLRQFADTYGDRDVAFHSAALAFFIVVALPAFLVFFFSIVGVFIAGETLIGWLVEAQIVSLASVERVQDQIVQFSSWTALASAVIVMWSGSAIFHRVQQGLRSMWHIELKVGSGVRRFFAQKLLAIIASLIFVVAIVSLFLFMQSVDLFVTHIGMVIPGLVELLPVAQLLQFFLIVSAIALIYAIFGDAIISFRLLVVGSILVAACMLLVQFGVQSYISNLAAVSWYGAAGSIIVLLFSLYFVSIIFYAGAILMYVLADRYKTFRLRPRSYAQAGKEVGLWQSFLRLFH